MSKAGGSLPRGRRLLHEIPPTPSEGELTPLQRRAQRTIRSLVDRAGGPLGVKAQMIPVDGLGVIGELFDEWARTHGERTGDGIRFSGRPGLWHALDELYPLQDPNRWDALRNATLSRLEETHWRRISPPRGSAFEVRLPIASANRNGTEN